MKTNLKLAGLCVLMLTPAAAAPPQISAILNAASYALPGMPNSGIAQGSVFVVFGSELGPAELQQASSFPLQTTLAGTSLRVTVGTTSVDAILIYTWTNQVAAILPSNTPAGIGLLAVTYNGRTSQSGAFRILRSVPGILAQNEAGSGPALAQNFNSSADQPRNAFTRAARPGQVVTLWGTGLGPIAGNDAVVPVPQDLNLDLQLLVGGKPATVRYKGRSGCCAGVDQIVFEVPRDVEGCYVPVVVKVGDVVSNFTTISVASTGNICSDLSGLSGSDLEKLQSGGVMTYGSISLQVGPYCGDCLVNDTGTYDAVTYDESGGGQFFRSGLGQLFFGRVPLGLPSLGSCLVSPPSSGVSAQVTPSLPVPLDAGPVLNVSGPKGTKQIPLRSPGNYFQQFSTNSSQIQYLQPGNYTVDNGAGGADVGPFRVNLTTPPPFTSALQLSATAVTVTWRGGDPTGYVTIRGFTAPTPPAVSGAQFVCTERVSAGQFTLPPAVLLSLPANFATSTSGRSISLSYLPVATFRATGLDVGQFSYSSYLASGSALR